MRYYIPGKLDEKKSKIKEHTWANHLKIKKG
jgi:hypothetical protein